MGDLLPNRPKTIACNPTIPQKATVVSKMGGADPDELGSQNGQSSRFRVPELPRISLPRTWVNKGKEKSRGHLPRPLFLLNIFLAAAKSALRVLRFVGIFRGPWWAKVRLNKNFRLPFRGNYLAKVSPESFRSCLKTLRCRRYLGQSSGSTCATVMWRRASTNSYAQFATTWLREGPLALAEAPSRQPLLSRQ